MNKNIDQDAYQRYMDATAALIMEHCTSDMGETICKEAAEKEDFPFPRDLDSRCRELIQKECTEKNKKNLWSGLSKGLRYAASFVVILLAAFGVLFVSVEAVRTPIIDFYVERSEGYWVLSENIPSQQVGSNDPEAVDFADPLANLLPEEYQLVMVDGDSIDQIVAIYEKSAGCEIFFSAASSDSSSQIDSESAEISQIYNLSGKDIVLVVEGKDVRISWIEEDLATTFTLIATDMPSDQLLSIAEKFIERIS